jgi:hypothetical protein
VKKVLCSWESPFANCLSGAPGGDYLSRAIVDCRGAPTVDTAFMGLTSCRRITIAKTLAQRRRECAIDIMPTAVSLSNAPPTATPSSVMGHFPPTAAITARLWLLGYSTRTRAASAARSLKEHQTVFRPVKEIPDSSSLYRGGIVTTENPVRHITPSCCCGLVRRSGSRSRGW